MQHFFPILWFKIQECIGIISKHFPSANVVHQHGQQNAIPNPSCSWHGFIGIVVAVVVAVMIIKGQFADSVQLFRRKENIRIGRTLEKGRMSVPFDDIDEDSMAIW